MTNFENIKSMTTIEFYHFMSETNLDECFCPMREMCYKYKSCEECFVDWLNSECDTKT